MKKIWFRRKLYGLGWYPATWQGWTVVLLYFAGVVHIFRKIDEYSHSGSDTIIGIVVPVLALTCILVAVSRLTGERMRWQWGNRAEDISDVLLRGGVAVLATDTTYGIVGSALNERTVNEIYRLRKRDLDKPFIVLVADRKDLRKFGVKLTAPQEKILDKAWPRTISSDEIVRPTDSNRFRLTPTSVILSCSLNKLAYLHRGKNTIAFRLPKKESLRRLIREVGPLVAPSANPQGYPVARTIAEARAYFGHHVDFYQDGGTISASPSKLIDIRDGTEKVLRP